MSSLSQDQMEKRASIQKTAKIVGIVVGVIVGLLALWILSGQGGAVRYGGAIAAGLVAGGLANRASFKSGSKSAQCEKCGAAFSRSRTDRQETLVSSEAQEKREEQEDKSVKVTTWVEETYDVVDTYTCANCGDVETKSYQTTRRRDEKTVVEPFKPEEKAAPAKKPRRRSASSAAAEEASAGDPKGKPRRRSK